MSSRKPLVVMSIVGVLACVLTWNLSDAFPSKAPLASPLEAGIPVAGNPATLLAKYEGWKQAIEGNEPVLVVGLHWSRGLANGKSIGAFGRAAIDLRDGSVRVDLENVPPGETLAVWLFEGRADGSILPGAGDRRRLAGTLQADPSSPSGRKATLDASMSWDAFPDFALGLVVVTRAGGDPEREGLLFGVPSLFQRIYFQELQGAGSDAPPLSMGVTTCTTPDPDSILPEVFAAMVARGENLFMNATFNGNGRKCATCHPPANNFTLDPEFVQSLPDSDPLFVAEDPSSPLHVDNTPGNKRFEAPRSLMESHALVLENVDGFPCPIGECSDDPGQCCVADPDCNTGTCQTSADRFVMRGVQHLFALGLTKGPAGDGIDPPADRLGWGGDGSPVGQIGEIMTSGTLVDFALGAVRQHFPNTINRVPGGSCGTISGQSGDFCVPTCDQLEDLAAFQLSLGRQAEFGFPGVVPFSDSMAASGARFFFQPLGISCFRCHNKAGSDGFLTETNDNLSIGTETVLQADNPDPTLRPPDGGFGTGPCGKGPCTNPPSECFPDPPVEHPCDQQGLLGFGDLTFNVQSVVEAADTPPFFHNSLDSIPAPVSCPNADDTCTGFIEDAVLFYTLDAFPASPDGLHMDFVNPPNGDPDCRSVQDIARALRVLNSLDNIDSQAVPPLQRAIDILVENSGPQGAPVDITPLLTLSVAHLGDTTDVLQQCQRLIPTDGPLNADSVALLDSAISRIRSVPGAPPFAKLARLEMALEDICCARTKMLDPTEPPCPWWESGEPLPVCD